MTVVAPDGTTRFKLRGGRAAADRLLYYPFDVLDLDGWDLRPAPLEERKERLALLLKDCKHPGPVQLVEHLDGEGPMIFAKVVELEGIVSKRAGSNYHAGKSGSG